MKPYHERYAVPVVNNKFNYMCNRLTCVPYVNGTPLPDKAYCVILNEGSYTNGKHYRTV